MSLNFDKLFSCSYGNCQVDKLKYMPLNEQELPQMSIPLTDEDKRKLELKFVEILQLQ